MDSEFCRFSSLDTVGFVMDSEFCRFSSLDTVDFVLDSEHCRFSSSDMDDDCESKINSNTESSCDGFISSSMSIFDTVSE
jgi:hypothetical protein